MKSFTTKAYQWVEGYRSCTDGEIKTILKTFYKMECWQDLHVALWAWLSLDGKREKYEWFEKFDVPRVSNDCFACVEAREYCYYCPLTKPTSEHCYVHDCLNGLYEQWLIADYSEQKEKLARKIATMKWEERL